MITLKFTEASRFQNSLINKDFCLLVKKRRFFIGRGEELQQKLSDSNGIIDLINFDNTLSRVHASVNFSPAWFLPNAQNSPGYLSQLKLNEVSLPHQIIQRIWLFLRPLKACVIRDLKSKVGIFRKIEQQMIKSEMIIEFVHQSFIEFKNCEQYSTYSQLSERVGMLKQNQPELIVFGNLSKIKLFYQQCNDEKQKKEILKIWTFTVKETKYILLVENNLILRIGRSSHCEIQIKDTAISRYQAYLKCENNQWKIIDGNPIEKSKNGTWLKSRSIEVKVSKNEDLVQKTFVKIGTIKCEIEVIQNFEWLDIQKIAEGEESKSFIQIGMGNLQQENDTRDLSSV